MSAWIIIALGIIALGIIIGVIAECQYLWGIGLAECIECALGICVVEAIVYGFYKLIPWVVGWDTNILTKVSFISIPATLVLSVVFVLAWLYASEEGETITSRIFSTLMVLSLASFVASIFICPVAAWISSTTWRIAIWAPLGLILVFCVSALFWATWTYDGKDHSSLSGEYGSYAVATGPSGDCVSYYSSKREYRKSQAQWEYEKNYGWDWGGPAV